MRNATTPTHAASTTAHASRAWVYSVLFHVGSLVLLVPLLVPIMLGDSAESDSGIVEMVVESEPDAMYQPELDAPLTHEPIEPTFSVEMERVTEPVETVRAEDTADRIDAEAQQLEYDSVAWPGLNARPQHRRPPATQLDTPPAESSTRPTEPKPVEAPPAAAQASTPAVQAKPDTAPQPTGVTQPARLSSGLKVKYPRAERKRQRTATVVMEVRVDAEGHPCEIRLLSLDVSRHFERAAREAIEAARFQPALSNGQPCADLVRLRVHFKLH